MLGAFGINEQDLQQWSHLATRLRKKQKELGDDAEDWDASDDLAGDANPPCEAGLAAA